MCLSVHSREIEIKEDNTAVVVVLGARRLISLDLLQEEIGVGDWVLGHEGVACIASVITEVMVFLSNGIERGGA